MAPMLFRFWSPWWGTAQELLAGLEEVVTRRRRAPVALMLLLVSTTGAWFVYVPIHELLHALGCLATGGTVEELQIQTLYGGALLEMVFPFVRAGGEYAGRLTRFDTGGSDLVYLATDFSPYLLTVAGAFPCLRLSVRKKSVWLLGVGAVLAIAPLLSLPGDYYEMGSIVVSSGLALLIPGASPERLAALRHDDLAALLGEFGTRFPDHRAGWGAAVSASAILGFLFASATLAAGRFLAGRILRSAGPSTAGSRAGP